MTKQPSVLSRRVESMKDKALYTALTAAGGFFITLLAAKTQMTLAGAFVLALAVAACISICWNQIGQTAQRERRRIRRTERNARLALEKTPWTAVEIRDQIEKLLVHYQFPMVRGNHVGAEFTIEVGERGRLSLVIYKRPMQPWVIIQGQRAITAAEDHAMRLDPFTGVELALGLIQLGLGIETPPPTPTGQQRLAIGTSTRIMFDRSTTDLEFARAMERTRHGMIFIDLFLERTCLIDKDFQANSLAATPGTASAQGAAGSGPDSTLSA